MRPVQGIALLVALFVIGVGVVALLAPDALMKEGELILTPAGLYGIGALRVAVGIVLLAAAPTSRAPKLLRVFGAIVIVAGLFTPIFGVDRSRAVLAWEAARGLIFMRIGGAIAIILGALIGFAITGRRTAAA